ncbi:hypothetical protein NEHOM01_0402 [Nematocida homosporus]|uniref:uncharacterized protein n=1 Tax=Nematocida homosporus TaxID=1912981 RepID=UPI0022210CFD|nr:uncharacterized protein NEHOM01_0402 [Nematocida homosporus]KAI5184800.1 hypothetical protein NEHOM01_0402 [Nematocida homosporus]
MVRDSTSNLALITSTQPNPGVSKSLKRAIFSFVKRIDRSATYTSYQLTQKLLQRLQQTSTSFQSPSSPPPQASPHNQAIHLSLPHLPEVPAIPLIYLKHAPPSLRTRVFREGLTQRINANY